MYNPFRKIISSLFNPPKQDGPGWPDRVLKIDDTGFVVIDAKDPAEVRCDWVSVREVFAYKIDLFSYDEICLGFRVDDAGTSWWVGESYTGYQALLDELPRRFQGIKTDWIRAVSVPAFVENRMTLWGEALPLVELLKLKKRRWLFW